MRRFSLLREVPRPIYLALGLLGVLALLPPAMIAVARARLSDKPRVQLAQDMGVQVSLRPQAYDRAFADRRAMRLPVPETVPQSAGALRDDPCLYRGLVRVDGQEQWTTTYPDSITVNQQLLERGRQRFGIYCAVCHGDYGYGNGLVHERAKQITPSWVAPANLRGETVKQQPNGYLFSVISNGVRTMPSYASQIPVADRWAIIAYLRELQSN